MQQGDDHDLLIRVDTRLETLIKEVQLMRDGTKEQIRNLEVNKLDINTFSTYISSKEKSDSEARRDWEEANKKITESIGLHEQKLAEHTRLIYIGFGIVITIQFVVLIFK